ncbi:MAG: type IVB secretion system protein IcmH/DotU [Methylococcaceae bacterium]|nr:type IVB secretion system protein IcmH/DotU [Methylococcaceae bacterium]
MSQDDPFTPFGDDDRTRVRRPSPGGRGRTAPLDEFASPTLQPPPKKDLDAEGIRRTAVGDNPVTSAALSLLSLVSRLRNTVSHRDIAGLQQQLVTEIRAFENRILQQGMAQEQTRMASYLMCALLDETILNTPWGAQSIWGHQSLAVLFHKEAWGGEKFFPIIDHLARQPSLNLHLLELGYLCLSLGFVGKYRVMANGLNELDKYRNELYQLILRVRGDFERSLSPRWQGLKEVRNALMRFVPLWVVAAVAGAILFLAYLGFLFSISGFSDQTLAQLSSLSREKIKTAQPLPPPVVKPPVPGRVERFTVLLKEEIDRNMVEVIDDRTLRIRNSFPSGSDQVKAEFVPMLKKIAQELGSGQDTVLVSGHTDNIPIRNARFPSNWDLSIARAKHVADLLLASGALNGRVRSKGSADGEPLAPNDTPEHRALNRRVDLSIQ